MRLSEARRDLYRRLAREQGYKSRAAFKLIEANERYGFIRRGDRVADFGAAPGGWLQVASALVGEDGVVVGVDLSPIRLKEKNVVAIKMDAHDPVVADKVSQALGGKADVVLSDLAPAVTGVWELDQTRQVDLTLRVLELSRTLLKDGGRVYCKLFEGERSQEVRDEFKRMFRSVRVIKPAASRSAASELYYLCEGMKS
ncbi:MAG: RlmE family RNA methyltransferase [Nitrososphaerota archaeon]|jgi:23S rRNA (uridine2552-2'-O)-methyltransferase|nr:RlmE family RNA methyltransferase [Nitrososphaerota archaeon]MDG6918704.1 RlmE family RNA methyltransferase [Nitrososphaerota archaeon]MDG6946674.1 RlmE family RNA methyltransferase [Nitrososphaerota archaeon]MDG6948194.1 RlmE family RNA methyltransferase [Nitrososphaerota archaeon]